MIWYNRIMIRNNNTNRKENEMKTLSFNEMVAIKMNSSLTNESDQITEIGRVLTDMGKSRTERIYLLSVDEDFISDVLACYKPVQDTEYGFFLAAR